MSKKKYSGLIDHNFLTNEAIITRITSLDKILTFQLGCIFSAVSKISENRHIKY